MREVEPGENEIMPGQGGRKHAYSKVLTIRETHHNPTLSCLLATAEKEARCKESIRAKKCTKAGSGEVLDMGG